MKKAVLVVFLILIVLAFTGCTRKNPYEESLASAQNRGNTVQDDFLHFETFLDSMLNQGHAVGYDVYDPAVEKFSQFEASDIPSEDLERVRQKIVRLRPEVEGQTSESQKPEGNNHEEEKQSTPASVPIKKGLLSPRGCNGTGSFMLGATPLALEDIEKIRPMGGLSSVHITPTDHQYWDTLGNNTVEDTTDLDRFKVFAPADGFIVDIEQKTDYRVVIEHSCTFYTIFIHIDKLAEKVMAAAGLKGGEVGKHSWERIPVKEGEVIGTIGVGKLDFSVVDEAVTLKDFVNPESYEGEPWKIHTVDTFDYYEEPFRSKLIAKNVRMVQPLGGKIDYDIDGKLVGNWFREGSNGYKGDESADYWKNHLSIVYDSIDPSQIRVAIGDFGGWSQVFGATGNTPDPATVDGLVKYELTTFDYYLGDTGTKFNPAKYSNNIRSRNLNEVRGVALFKVLPENKLQAEFFPDKKAGEVAGFTGAAEIYER